MSLKWGFSAWLGWGGIAILLLLVWSDNALQESIGRFLVFHFISGLNLLLIGKGVARIVPVVQEPGDQDQRAQLDRGLPLLVWLALKGIAFLGLIVMLFQTKQPTLLPTVLGIGAFVAVPMVLGIVAATHEQRD